MTLVRSLMSTAFSCITLLAVDISIAAETVATCKDLRGYAIYHHGPLVPKGKSGIQDDAMTGGITTLTRIGENDYDVLFVDSRQTIISTKQDGGIVTLLRKGTSDATFLVAYPGMAIEILTFYRDASGADKLDLLQSKGGDGMPIHKSALFTGNCLRLNLSLVR